MREGSPGNLGDLRRGSSRLTRLPGSGEFREPSEFSDRLRTSGSVPVSAQFGSSGGRSYTPVSILHAVVVVVVVVVELWELFGSSGPPGGGPVGIGNGFGQGPVQSGGGIGFGVIPWIIPTSRG